MTLKTKIVKNVDDDVWRQFSGYCKIDNVLVGQKLNEILKDHLNKKQSYKGEKQC